MKEDFEIGAFSGHFHLKIGFSQPRWPSGWHFFWKNAGLSEGIINSYIINTVQSVDAMKVMYLKCICEQNTIFGTWFHIILSRTDLPTDLFRSGNVIATCPEI